MQPNISCYQHKIDQNNYKMFYISLIATIKQNPSEVIQMIRRKQSRHTTAENGQIIKPAGEEESKTGSK